MPLCARCHQNEATIHLTTVVDGATTETVHLCKDCAPFTGMPALDATSALALPVTGMKCDFCAAPASAGMQGAGDPVFWCLNCSQEFGRIVSDLIAAERPHLFQRSAAEPSFLSLCQDPDFQVWAAEANRRALQILRDRKASGYSG